MAGSDGVGVSAGCGMSVSFAGEGATEPARLVESWRGCELTWLACAAGRGAVSAQTRRAPRGACGAAQGR